MDTFVKQPAEAIRYTTDFSERLADGDTVASVAYSGIANTQGTVSGDAVPTLSDEQIDSSVGVRHLIAGGLSGQTYKVTVRVATTLGETLEHEYRLKVKDI